VISFDLFFLSISPGGRAKDDEELRLEEEIGELRRRIGRIKEDIEFTNTGRRTEEKDRERRALERVNLFLHRLLKCRTDFFMICVVGYTGI
jgi:hypothetical protein